MESVKKQDILVGAFTLLMTFLILSQTLQTQIIRPRLYDGTINTLGRYSMTFDAYEHIRENSNQSVIALGSSKMREIFDGEIIQDYSNTNIDFYNLAYAGELPYVRMVEIDAIIKTNPKAVILEVGPNTFSYLSDPLPEKTLALMSHLVSLNPYHYVSSWESQLSENDSIALPMDISSQKQLLAKEFALAFEMTLEYEFNETEQPYSCDKVLGRVNCVPLPNTEYYDEYLRHPIQFRNSLKSIKNGDASFTIEEFYGPRLDAYINRSYHNPEGTMNKNQQAYEFIIESLIQANIDVILVGLPYNPVLLDRLAPGQWDYYNSTVSTYADDPRIHVFDMMWDPDWEEDDFNDFTHATASGEERFANKISFELERILKKES